jgi:hypothetical protein
MRPTVQIVPLFSQHCLDHIHCIFYILEGAGPLQTLLTSQDKQRRTQWHRPTPTTLSYTLGPGPLHGIGPLRPLYLTLWVRVHCMARKDEVDRATCHQDTADCANCPSHDNVYITSTASYMCTSRSTATCTAKGHTMASVHSSHSILHCGSGSIIIKWHRPQVFGRQRNKTTRPSYLR